MCDALDLGNAADEESVSAEKGVEESAPLAPRTAQAVSRHLGAGSREASGEEESPVSSRGEPPRGSGPSNAAATSQASAEARTVGRLSKTRHFTL